MVWIFFNVFGGGVRKQKLLRLIIIDFSYTIFYWIHNKQSVNNTPPQRWLFDLILYFLLFIAQLWFLFPQKYNNLLMCVWIGHQITMTKNYSKLLRNFQWYCDEGNVHSVAFDVLSMTECLSQCRVKVKLYKNASETLNKRIIRILRIRNIKYIH